ncbi:MAG: hypothetical protein WCG80_06640 [Spirochaetales bacterium]
MLVLSNDALFVSILDPDTDTARLGHRYNTGGSVFQVTDTRVGELLSGPTYPHDYNTYDGQGLPDSFPERLSAGGPLALGLGVGLVDVERKVVVEPCRWDVNRDPGRLRFLTRHTWEGWDLELERTLTLSGRTLHSLTRMTNRGNRPADLTWFPHPFYPPTRDQLFRPDVGFPLPEHRGFGLDSTGWVFRRAVPWTEASLVRVEYGAEAPATQTFLQRHPKLGMVAARFDYAPQKVVLWGNDRTFSFEPYLHRELPRGETTEWTATYDF